MSFVRYGFLSRALDRTPKTVRGLLFHGTSVTCDHRAFLLDLKLNVGHAEEGQS